eukprot:SAG25_NODE_717_length_5757_cov_2.821138_1_plen_79_part_10
MQMQPEAPAAHGWLPAAACCLPRCHGSCIGILYRIPEKNFLHRNSVQMTDLVKHDSRSLDKINTREAGLRVLTNDISIG